MSRGHDRGWLQRCGKAGADGVCLCTMYDVRFGKFARVARDAERMQSGILKALRGRGYKGTEAPGGAYVRWTMYDCEVRAR